MSRLSTLQGLVFNKKIVKYAKKQENTALSKGKKKLAESIPGEAQTVGLLDKGFNCAPVTKENHGRGNKGNQNDELNKLGVPVKR